MALALEAVLLTGLLVSWLAGRPLREPNALAAISAGLSAIFAMGVQSALVRLLMQGSPSTGVMTTNTTQLAIETTEFLLAWRRLPRRPAAARPIAANDARCLHRCTVDQAPSCGSAGTSVTLASHYLRVRQVRAPARPNQPAGRG